MRYIFTEIGSIAENAQALGAPVPNWLTSGIKKLMYKTDDIGNKRIRRTTALGAPAEG